MNAASVAGKTVLRELYTRRKNDSIAAEVPPDGSPLWVPNKVAGGVVGKAENRAGIRIHPPPPTMESTRSAASAKGNRP
jgi:hypothetical protein